MSVLVTASEVHIRIYADDAVVDLSKPVSEQEVEYKVFCVATISDSGVARLQGLCGRHFTRQNYNDIKEALRRYGANTATYRRGRREISVKL